MSDGQSREPKELTPARGSEASQVSRVEAKTLKNLDETLRAMRSSLDKGKQFVAMGRQKFDDDWMVQDAAITTVTQIAEAAKRLPKSF